MALLPLPWVEGSETFGAGTVFGECAIPPEVRNHIDGMIGLGGRVPSLAELVAIERDAERVAFAFSLEGIEAALSGAPNAERIPLLWALGASFGAASTMALCAQRVAQVTTLCRTEGEA